VVKERNRSRSPLFQVMFTLLNTDDVPDLSLEKLSWSMEPYAADTSKFDITCQIEESSSGIRVEIEYCTDVFRTKTIDRMIGHYMEVLTAVIADADIRIEDIDLLTSGERELLLKAFDHTESKYPRDKTILDLITEKAEGRWGAVAVVYEGQRMSYGELNRRSNQLAHYLRDKGVGPEVLVGICMDRSVEMIVGILGILKAGGAYVPIDPAYPLDRIGFMLKDSKAALVVSVESYAGLLGGYAEGGLVLLDRDREVIRSCGAENIEVGLKPAHLAYVIYTSGTTGRPKGVMVEHGNVVKVIKNGSGAI